MHRNYLKNKRKENTNINSNRKIYTQKSS